jgi:hypothetical protein
MRGMARVFLRTGVWQNRQSMQGIHSHLLTANRHRKHKVKSGYGEPHAGIYHPNDFLSPTKEKTSYVAGHKRLIQYNNLARPERFERPTLWFVAKYSIQLSYGRQGVTTLL